VCPGTLVHYEQTLRERIAMPGRMQRVCTGGFTGATVHYEQTVGERVARSGRSR
jgi:hypothetical protein